MLAWPACSAFCCVIDDISSSDELISSRLDACSVEPSASDWLDAAIWPAPESICADPAETSLRSLVSDSDIVLTEAVSSPISSLLVTCSALPVRSPSAMSFARFTTGWITRLMFRAKNHPQKIATIEPTITATADVTFARVAATVAATTSLAPMSSLTRASSVSMSRDL